MPNHISSPLVLSRPLLATTALHWVKALLSRHTHMLGRKRANAAASSARKNQTLALRMTVAATNRC